MSNAGWISIHRKLQDSPIFKDSVAVHLWLYLLLSANHKENKILIGNKMVIIPRGSLLTGRKSLANAINCNESKITRLLKLFENEQQIEQQTFSKYRLISISNYSQYQDNEQQVNSKRTASEQQVNTNNNVNNTNNDNNKSKDISPQNLKVLMTHDFRPNANNKKWLNDSNIPEHKQNELIRDFIDYWILDKTKRSTNGWQQSFRKNPIIKRAVTNHLHSKVNSNEKSHRPSTRREHSQELGEHLRNKIRATETTGGVDGEIVREIEDNLLG